MPSEKHYDISPGIPYPVSPFGASVENDGVMFRVFSRNAERVWLLLFDRPEDTEPAAEIEFNPETCRSGDIWHMHVRYLQPGQLYLFRIDGPYSPEDGHRFDAEQWLLDPFARAITGCNDWGSLEEKKKMLRKTPKAKRLSKKLDFAGLPKCVVLSDEYNWEGDTHLHHPPNDTIIYEAHVRGLSVHPGSAFKYPGTFKGVAEIIPHLKELGITTLELLPVQEFNELDIDRTNPLTGRPLLNYWGYNTVGFFAPNGQYSSSGVTGEQVAEFRDRVKRLHAAGIEVLLDIVFNHTAEGNEYGPVYSFKGIDNSIFYLLDERDGSYINFSGCGNTFNCNNPFVRQFIRACLRYWVVYMHVDGFRFDLASILGRDQNGALMENPPLLESIAEDPVLRNIKLIAEAWDLGGAYQVGSFPGERWAEWNGRFRDDVRAFLRGDSGARPAFAYRLTGSSDLYLRKGRTPLNSINFITSHDGFTLNDLVTFANKHNEANGEENRDGDNNNLSDNHGVEGETSDPEINSMRIRSIKNFLTVLMLSQGIPMLTAGDEFRRTQNGNNNAYCQDNEISWIDWSLKEKNGEIFNFCKKIIAFRKAHPVFRRTSFFTGAAVDLENIPDISWYDSNNKTPDWKADSHTLACLIHGKSSVKDSQIEDDDIFIIFNTGSEAVKFEIPRAPSRKQWYMAVNTARSTPGDIFNPGSETLIGRAKMFWLVPRSIIVLLAK